MSAIRPLLMRLGSMAIGTEWIEMNAGIPTISFRDIVIQRDHEDVVAASFGRGMFVLGEKAAGGPPVRRIGGVWSVTPFGGMSPQGARVRQEGVREAILSTR